VPGVEHIKWGEKHRNPIENQVRQIHMQEREHSGPLPYTSVRSAFVKRTFDSLKIADKQKIPLKKKNVLVNANSGD
jgi:hypothetical protein